MEEFSKRHQHFPVKVMTTERTNIHGMNDISCILASAPFTINDRVEDDSIICISEFIPEGRTHSELVRVLVHVFACVRTCLCMCIYVLSCAAHACILRI